jgi:hypothetical protein
MIDSSLSVRMEMDGAGEQILGRHQPDPHTDPDRGMVSFSDRRKSQARAVIPYAAIQMTSDATI